MTSADRTVLRSLLYVPGDAGMRLQGATARGADAVVADLEDGVAPTARPGARIAVAAWLGHAATRTSQRWVRVNPGAEGIADVRATYSVHLDGIVLAKVDGVEVLDDLARAFADIVPDDHARPRVMVLIETARGLRDVDAIAEHPVVELLQLGELDLAADLGLDPEESGLELQYARSRVVVAAAAAGIAPPLGAVSTGFSDLERLRVSTQRLRRLGFVGRAAIHPAQLPVIHEIFTPSAEQVRAAQDLVETYSQALAAGRGVITDDAGLMIDEAMVRASRRTIALADDLNLER